MPQIYIIIGPEAQGVLNKERIRILEPRLTLVIEEAFGIEGENDVALTDVFAEETIREMAVQFEIRYTAGECEYKEGQIFDPKKPEQEELEQLIHEEFLLFLREQGLEPLTHSVWCKPYYNSSFRMFGLEE